MKISSRPILAGVAAVPLQLSPSDFRAAQGLRAALTDATASANSSSGKPLPTLDEGTGVWRDGSGQELISVENFEGPSKQPRTGLVNPVTNEFYIVSSNQRHLDGYGLLPPGHRFLGNTYPADQVREIQAAVDHALFAQTEEGFFKMDGTLYLPAMIRVVSQGVTVDLQQIVGGGPRVLITRSGATVTDEQGKTRAMTGAELLGMMKAIQARAPAANLVTNGNAADALRSLSGLDGWFFERDGSIPGE